MAEREPHGILEASGRPVRSTRRADTEVANDARVGNRSRARCVIWRGRLLSEGLLLVVELDVGLIQQGDVEAEREVAVRGLEKREARVPAVQVALEANGVGPELPCVEVVVRVPGRRPMRRRLEREGESHLLTPSGGADRCRVRLWARPDLGVVERQVEPPAPGADGHPARPSNSGPIKRIGCATRLEPRASLVARSEEHTSELQSPCNLVCRLLLEK